MLTTLAIIATLATAPQPDAELTVSLKLSIGSWVDEHAEENAVAGETPIAPAKGRAKSWGDGRGKIFVYFALGGLDASSTDWSIARGYHEANPLPGMNTKTGRMIILPAIGMGCAWVDRYLTFHVSVKAGRIWRWSWWIGSAMQILANFHVLPYWATPSTVLMPFKRSK